MKIKLEELANALAQSDVLPGYVDLAEGHVILLREDWQDEAAFTHAMRIEEDFDRYVPLTNVCDSDEYDVMQAFAREQSPEVRACLMQALQGKGASLRFQRQVQRLSLKTAWHAFWHAHLIQVARFFCEENEIEYEE